MFAARVLQRIIVLKLKATLPSFPVDKILISPSR